MNAPPSSPRSEAALLTLLLADDGAFDEVEGRIDPESFYVEGNSHTFRAMLDARARGRAVNFVTVLESLDRMKLGHVAAHVTSIMDTLPTASVPDLVAELRAVHQRREIVRACMELGARGYNEEIGHAAYVADVEARLAGIINATNTRADSLRQINPDKALHAIVETMGRSGKLGLSTTISELDVTTGGVGKGHVMIVGGYPGMGKTGMAIAILEHAALNRHLPCAFFSLEMPEADIAKRLLSRRSGVQLSKMRDGTITAAEVGRLNDPHTELKSSPIFIYDTPEPTIGTIRSESRRLRARNGELGCIVIDYLQLVRGVGRFDVREQEVASVSRGIKALAKEIDCPVIALAQLNAGDTSKPNPRPRAKDLRESRGIWNDADYVVLIHDPNKGRTPKPGETIDPYVREFIVDKNRHGPTGIAMGRFDKTTATFLDPGVPTVSGAPKRVTGADPYAHVGGSPDDGSGDGESWVADGEGYE